MRFMVMASHLGLGTGQREQERIASRSPLIAVKERMFNRQIRGGPEGAPQALPHAAAGLALELLDLSWIVAS
jgi:hypothetical protein